MLIVKVSFIIISLSFFLTFFIGKMISRKLLSQLKHISQEVQNINIEEKLPQLHFIGVKNDEISILTRALNDSFRRVENQTQHLKQFLTDVSHEFKTPLMVINSKMELSEKKMNSQNIQTEIPELFKTLKNQTKKLNELLETLFFLSRAESGLVSLKTQK
jgi:signal transduction histidine kinase